MRFDKRYKIHQAAAREESRYMIAAIKLELEPPQLIATTGRICAIVPCTVNGNDTEGLIPKPAIVAAVKGKQILEAVLERAEPQPDGAESIDVYQDGALVSSHKLAEGNFPRWQEVVPKIEGNDLVIGLNPYYLVDLAKAIGCASTGIGVELRVKLIKVDGEHRVADKPIRVTALENDEGAFGVMMPVSGS